VDVTIIAARREKGRNRAPPGAVWATTLALLLATAALCADLPPDFASVAPGGVGLSAEGLGLLDAYMKRQVQSGHARVQVPAGIQRPQRGRLHAARAYRPTAHDAGTTDTGVAADRPYPNQPSSARQCELQSSPDSTCRHARTPDVDDARIAILSS
jgi:hypothetical protein